MKMTGLETLYGDMKHNNINHTIFDYVHTNKVQLVILFDIGTKPFSLFLIKKYSDKQSLLITIEKGFNLNIFLPKDKLQLLVQMLEIRRGTTNRFSTKVFFQELNAKIPPNICQYELDKDTRKAIAYAKNFEDKDKIFVQGLIDWDKMNSKKRYTQFNREKTRILRPDIYNKIKDKNISVKYTSDTKYEIDKDFSQLEVISGNGN